MLLKVSFCRILLQSIVEQYPGLLLEREKSMANEEQLSILKQSVEVWNRWREQNPDVTVDLSEADLYGATLSGALLIRADLSRAALYEANLKSADLNRAKLSGAKLNAADLREAKLRGADLREAELSEADLSEADLNGAFLWGADLFQASLTGARLRIANLFQTDLRSADFRGADLNGADLTRANLTEADLSGADLTDAYLEAATLLRTNIDQAKVSGSSIYSINVWGLKGEFLEQNNLVITPKGAPIITVDNIEIAQFIYLILNNEKVRDVINTLTSKSVLILGRFAVPERKAILDALRNKLREYNLLPIVFDFDRPSDKDFTETIKTLAGLSYFVIADVTNPKSTPLELQATVPDYQIPFVPIIQEGEQPFAMMVDLQKKYSWVLDTLSYRSIDELMKALKPAIIDPAIQKHNELRLIKAREPKIRSASDFIEDKGLE
jgi:uncharacterized protein YjbI with pentapeptide repeats